MFLVGNNDIDIVIASLEIFKTKSVYTLTFKCHTRNRLHLKQSKMYKLGIFITFSLINKITCDKQAETVNLSLLPEYQNLMFLFGFLFVGCIIISILLVSTHVHFTDSFDIQTPEVRSCYSLQRLHSFRWILVGSLSQ
jgi:hypothetical protein